MNRAFLLLPLAATLGLGLAGCADAEVGSDHGTLPEDRDKISSKSDPITKDEIMARADAYVAANVPYCGGVRGGTDYICGGTCVRPAAAWDAYRSDCSGFVSWCWQIASDPTTSTLMTDRSGGNGWTTVGLDALEAGDALVCDGHVKLFSRMVSATSAEIYEEYNCGHVGRKAVQTFTRTGDTLKFSGDSRVYHAIRRNGLSPTIPPPDVKGNLDSATTSVDGWAVDMSSKATALSVDAWIDGAPGKGHQLTGKADAPRPDVASSLGVDPNHGFVLPTPLYFCDGKAHPIQTLATPADGKSAAVPLTTTTKSITCPIPAAPAGVLRWVTTPTVLGAWKFDVVRELRWVTATDAAKYEKASNLPATPALRKTADGAIWVLDDGARRHVVDPASFAAWAFDDKSVVAMTDAEAATIPVGLPLPKTPVLVQSEAGAEVYVLDVKAAGSADPDGGSGDDGGVTTPGADGGVADGGGNGDAPTASSDMHGGCSVGDVHGSGATSFGFALSALGLAIAMRRRRKTLA